MGRRGDTCSQYSCRQSNGVTVCQTRLARYTLPLLMVDNLRFIAFKRSLTFPSPCSLWPIWLSVQVRSHDTQCFADYALTSTPAEAVVKVINTFKRSACISRKRSSSG